jgi:glycosyltransferase involved in cell wall biosynthesis
MKDTLSAVPDLTVVIPVYNEAEALQNFLPELIEISEKNGWWLIFVDDGSTDGSSEILVSLKDCYFVNVIKHKVNRGYGRALKSGIMSAATEYVVTMDGDGQHSVSDIEKTFKFALEKDADLVVGDRGRSKDASVYREFGKWIIKLFTRILMPLPVRDLNSGFKLYRTELVKKYIPLCPNTMAFSDVVTLAFINQRNLVMEHPISIQKRRSGKSTIGFHTAFDTIMEIINLVLLFNPLRIFLPVSAACILFGLGWGIPIILMGRGVSVGAMLAIVTGILFFILGLIASQISAFRISILEDYKRANEIK